MQAQLFAGLPHHRLSATWLSGTKQRGRWLPQPPAQLCKAPEESGKTELNPLEPERN